ncbi:MAG TPA: T9SS type A sorting domain-containing protein, partial [Chitinophagaceae bacterium]|nr:T9SS type A sorting domain-containing protein [Chitinophagaceae bacterium]
YPNPVSTTLSVQVSNDITGDITINVMNSSGTIIKTVKATKTSTQFTQQINVQDLPSGTYVVEIRFADGSRQTSQFVKA